MKLRTKLLLVGWTALLLLSVPGLALAQEAAHPPRRPAVKGRIEAKTESGFTLSTPHGEITVSVDANTQYRVPGVEQATLADLQIGDTVLVLGRRNEAGELLARRVAVLPPVPVGAIKGEVTAIEGQTLTVATRGGDKTLLTDENTQFRVPDVEEPTLADIQVGDRVFQRPASCLLLHRNPPHTGGPAGRRTVRGGGLPCKTGLLPGRAHPARRSRTRRGKRHRITG